MRVKYFHIDTPPKVIAGYLRGTSQGKCAAAWVAQHDPQRLKLPAAQDHYEHYVKKPQNLPRIEEGAS